VDGSCEREDGGVAQPVLELSFTAPEALLSELSSRLFEAGAGAVEERDTAAGAALVVYAVSDAQAEELIRAARRVARRAGCSAALGVSRRELDDSWRTEWTRYLEPEDVTDRVVLVPLGNTQPTRRGKKRLLFDPAMVFGVGSHPTTRLTARALERHCRAARGPHVLDVGTGSGVLAMIAALHGAKAVLGLDVDREAVANARKNAALNQLTDRCRFSARALAGVRERYELVVANIEAWVLEELATQLVRVTKPGGHLLLSGLLEERAAALGALFESFGMRLVTRQDESGWALLELARPTTQSVARARTPRTPPKPLRTSRRSPPARR